MTLAKSRGIAIPVELENQLTAVFNKSQMIMKHSRAWMTAGKIRSDTVSQQTQDYRNIIEGLQVCFTDSFMKGFPAAKWVHVTFVLLKCFGQFMMSFRLIFVKS